MKKFLVAGAAALTLAGGSFAFANSLSVSSETLASGSDDVDKGCESVAVSWDAEYVDNNYELSDIDLTGGTGCTTQAYKVTIAESDGTLIEEYEGDLVSGAASIDPTADAIDAADVGNVTAVITGSAVQ